MAGLSKQDSSTGPLPMSAAVLDFICLFTHDLKRKQKRWQDGVLKYHTFNKRIMVYDDRGHFIGDAHWQSEAHLETGDEFELDRGAAIVQVSDCTGQKEQDLTELLDKRARDVERRRVNATSRTSRPNVRGPVSSPAQDQSSHFQLRHRPLSDIVGAPTRIGRAVISPHSPYEARQMAQRADQNEDSRSPKRRKREESPPAKSHHARSLFGATLTLTPVTTSSRTFQSRISRDRPNAELRTLLEGRDIEQQDRMLSENPKHASPQMLKDTENSTVSPASGPLQLHSKIQSLKGDSSLAIASDGQKGYLKPIPVHMDDCITKNPSSKTDAVRISNKNQSKQRVFPQTSSLINGHDGLDVANEPQSVKTEAINTETTSDTRELKNAKDAKEIKTSVLRGEEACVEKGPRTELRIRPRQRRGLLMVSEKHPSEQSCKKTSTIAMEKSSELPRDIELENTIPATQDSDFPSRQHGTSNKSANAPKKQDEIAIQVVIPSSPPDDNGNVEDITNPGNAITSTLSNDKPSLIQLSESQEDTDAVGVTKPKSEKKANETTSLSGRRTRKRMVQYALSDDESDNSETTPVAKEIHKYRITESTVPRITKMARKSVRSREIIGLVLPTKDPTLSRPRAVDATTAAIDEGGNSPEDVQENCVKSRLQKPKTREPSSKSINRTSMVQRTAGCLSEDNSTNKPTPRLINPATRGKKAAKKEDAAGQLPQTIIQLDPSVTSRIGVQKVPSTTSTLPGFTKANGGAWSKHAEDLLGMTRPATRSARHR